MIANDKIKHLIVGLCFGLTSIILPLWLVVIISAIIFAGKEVYDVFKVNPTGFDFGDLLADLIGFMVGIGISLIL